MKNSRFVYFTRGHIGLGFRLKDKVGYVKRLLAHMKTHMKTNMKTHMKTHVIQDFF
jgi:hypothetical protein